jgi:hypothetical protein
MHHARGLSKNQSAFNVSFIGDKLYFKLGQMPSIRGRGGRYGI